MIPIGINSSAKAAPSAIIMTAGTASGYAGYSNGSLLGAFGSISSEPLTGQTLQALVYQAGTVTNLYFAGNIVSTLAAMTLYVDGVGYSLSEAKLSGGSTAVQWLGTGPAFIDGNTYSIRIE